MNTKRTATALALANLLAGGALAAEVVDIKDYLVDIGAGHVAAHEMIGLSGSLVSNLQTPKDIVAAVSALGDPSSKAGFGIAWSPGRSGFKPMGVPVSDYAAPGRTMSRLWGSTTFSYAQNKKSLQGVDYAQNAVAVHVSYYLNAKEDPVVAGYDAVRSAAATPCQEAARAVEVDVEALGARTTAAMRAASVAKGNLALDPQEIKAIGDKARMELQQDTLQNDLPRRLQRTRAERSTSADEATRKTLSQRIDALAGCARGVADTARAKWNASQLTLVLGQGWIKGPASGDARLSLGRHAAVALAYSREEMPNSLFNLTLRRVDRALDLGTIATTPAYKGESLAAARFTYGYGDGEKTYAIAEISNTKKGGATLADTAFRAAIGVDYRLAEGMWLELRAGRSRTSDGTRNENKAVFNLKFSPETTLRKETRD